MDEATLRRRRDRARRWAVAGIVLLLLFGFGLSYSSWIAAGGGAGMLAVFVSGLFATWVFVAVLLFTVATLAVWMYWGWRLHRAHDPWAYDPELDGPDPNARRGLDDARELPPGPPRPPRSPD